MEGLGKHHSTTQDQPVVGHSLVQGLYVLLERTCPLASHLYRQEAACVTEDMSFQSKIDLMVTLIRTFEPVEGTTMRVLLDSWYCTKCLWRAARKRSFLITTDLKSNRGHRVAHETAPWRLALAEAELLYCQAERVRVCPTELATSEGGKVVIVRHALDSPLAQARAWASSDLEADAQTLLAHISARWEIEVLFADSKEELGLDQYQLMSATAIVRL